MWQWIVLLYVAVGLALVLFTRARAVISDSMADVTTDVYPVWKVAIFQILLHAGSVLLWPIFLRSWLSKPKTAWDALKGNPIFQQQEALSEVMSLMSVDGVDADELPNGQGEFGMSASNPIPCKTVFGSTAYLGRLRTSDGVKVEYVRIGSVASDVSLHPVDAYEVSLPNGNKLATLYISPYHKRISGKAPHGFMLED